MISVEECLKYAAECETLAKTAGVADREQLLNLAKEWRALARLQSTAGHTRH